MDVVRVERVVGALVRTGQRRWRDVLLPRFDAGHNWLTSFARSKGSWVGCVLLDDGSPVRCRVKRSDDA